MQRPPLLPRTLARLVALVLLAALAAADVVVLKDGRRIEGSVVREDAAKVVVRTGLGELELARADVLRIERGKTARQEYAEREARAGSADDFFALGNWARDEELPSLARRAWKRAVALDGDHAGARAALGFVRHEGEWMTPAERDARVRAAEERAQLRKGLVRHGERWVTPEDKRRLEQELVEVDGRWVSFESAQRLAGLELFEGAWLPRVEALAREHAAAVARLAEVELAVVVTDDALVAGDLPVEWLARLGASLSRARAWFDGAFDVAPGLALYGGALAEVYAFGRDSEPYLRTVDHFAGLTRTAPPGWAEAVKRLHGLYWVDPYPLSSARAAHRDLEDLEGHCLHHLGHLALGRLGYDGRLLPPWYDEAVASLVAFRVQGRNAVFCQVREERASGGTGAGEGRSRYDFDAALVRGGRWEASLKEALAAGAVPPFEQLARKQFSELDLLDVAQGMAILAWLESRRSPGGGNALRAFHDVLRAHAPALPERILPGSNERRAAHEAAFRAAAGLDGRAADQEWRRWLASR